MTKHWTSTSGGEQAKGACLSGGGTKRGRGHIAETEDGSEEIGVTPRAFRVSWFRDLEAAR